MANQIKTVQGNLHIIKHKFADRLGAFLRYDVFVLDNSQYIEEATNAIKNWIGREIYSAAPLKEQKQGAILFENHEELDLAQVQNNSIAFKVNKTVEKLFGKNDHFDFYIDCVSYIQEKIFHSVPESDSESEVSKQFYYELLGVPLEFAENEDEASSVEDLEDHLDSMEIEQKKGH